MEAETVHLVQRPYPAIVDDLLTAVVGGVVNEPISFDAGEDFYPLAKPAQAVRNISGMVEGSPYTFQPDVDFVFHADQNAILWQFDETCPDDGSLFFVDYFPRGGQSPLTDTNVGSVTRTLSEAFGREIALVYRQIDQAYLAGFIDTARGKSLDLVVAILGVIRKSKDFAVGTVSFFRDAEVKGNITIPAGTALTTSQAEASFETTELRTLQRGQVRIDLPIRARENSRGPIGQVAPGTLTTLMAPIAGIARLTNFAGTVLGAADEGDDDLRARAKARLRALGKGTLAALLQTIAEQRASLTEVQDPNIPVVVHDPDPNQPLDQQTPPGTVALFVTAPPEQFKGLQTAIEQTRAAGIRANLVGKFIFVKPRLTVQLPATHMANPAKKARVIDTLLTAIQTYGQTLRGGLPLKGEDLLAAIQAALTPEAIVTLLEMRTWYADVEASATERLIKALEKSFREVDLSQDPEPIQQALSQIARDKLEKANTFAPSNGQRIPISTLVKQTDDQGEALAKEATPQAIRAGKFQIAPQTLQKVLHPGADGAPTLTGDWQIVLDADPADILLVEG
jgi:hypothetical protein